MILLWLCKCYDQVYCRFKCQLYMLLNIAMIDEDGGGDDNCDSGGDDNCDGGGADGAAFNDHGDDDGDTVRDMKT